MLIALYFTVTDVVLPQIAAIFNGLLEPVMTIVIILAALVMAFGAVGMRISNNLGSTVVGGIFRAISYICRTIIQAIGWIFRTIIRIIPQVFNGSRRFFTQLGMSSPISTIMGVFVTIVIIAVII